MDLSYGDWGLGIGDWGLGIGPNPQSPIPNPPSPIPNPHIGIFKLCLKKLKFFTLNLKIIFVIKLKCMTMKI